MESDVINPTDPSPIPGVTQLVDRPIALAVIYGQFESPAADAALERRRCDRLRLTPENGLDVTSALRTADLVLLGPDALDGDPGLQLISDLHRQFPLTRVLLLADAHSIPSSVMLRAMRVGVHDVIDPADGTAIDAALDQALSDHDGQSDRVLAIGAHPDDVEIGCAGALLEHRRRGDEITVLTLSRGQVGGPESARVGESMLAATSLGARLLIADLPDTRIDPGVDTIRLIEAVVAEVNPSVVYVHSKHDNHQDHRAVHTAAVSATRRVPRMYAYQSPSATNDFAPTKFVPIDTVMTQKVEVLGLFATQNERSYLEPDLVIAGARYWARHLAPRARYAEPFEILRTFVTQTDGTRSISVPQPSALAPATPTPSSAAVTR